MQSATRRQFLAGMMASGGASATAGPFLIASADEAASEDEARAEFEALRAPIPPEPMPDVWDEELEVVIVGSGGGGVFAAIRLGRAGYKVTLLERNFEIGGTTKYGANVFQNYGGHRLADELEWAYPEFPYDPRKVVEYLMNMQNFSGDPALLYEMAVQGPRCIDWMVDDLGLNWHGTSSAPTAIGQMMLFDENEQFVEDSKRFDIYQSYLDEAGVDTRLETEVLAFVADAQGNVVGLKVEGPDGEKYLKASRAVCLHAGGFELNRSLMMKYCPDCCRGIANIATMPYATGEIFRMGLGMGADVSGFDSMGAFESGIWWKDYGEYDGWFAAYPHNTDGNTIVRQPWLRINKLGERVPYFSTRGTSYPWVPRAGEMISADALCDQASLEMSQPDGKTYVCFDAKAYDLCMQDYFGTQSASVRSSTCFRTVSLRIPREHFDNLAVPFVKTVGNHKHAFCDADPAYRHGRLSKRQRQSSLFIVKLDTLVVANQTAMHLGPGRSLRERHPSTSWSLFRIDARPGSRTR